MKKLISLLIAACCATTFAVAGVEAPAMSVFNPDFAFPKDVEATAKAFLQANPPLDIPSRGATRLMASEELYVAQKAIDRNSINSSVEMLLGLAADEPNPATKAMFMAYTAYICNSDYFSSRGYFDTPAPDKIAVWNRNAFRMAADSLYLAAYRIAPPDAPLGNYAAALTYYNREIGLIRTVRDFILALLSNNFNRGYSEYISQRGLPTCEEMINDLPPDSPIRMYMSIGTEKRRPEKDRQFILDNLGQKNIEYAILSYMIMFGVQGKLSETYPFYEKLSQANLPQWEKKYIDEYLAYLKSPKGKIQTDSYVLENKPFDIQLFSNNTDSIIVDIYRFKTEPSRLVNSLFVPRNLYRSILFNPKSGIDIDTLTHRLSLPAGFYAAKIKDSDSQPAEFTVTPWKVAFILSGKDKRSVQILDVITGEGVAGLTVTAKTVAKGKNAKSKTLKTKTDSRGVATFPFPVDRRVTVYDSKRKLEITFNRFGLYNWTQSVDDEDIEETQELRASIFTDRPAYRPGDTVKFAVIVNHGETVAEGVTDSLNVTYRFGGGKAPTTPPEKIATPATDAFGRTEGEFKIPDDAEPGTALLTYRGNPSIINIADFKLPEISISNSGYIFEGDSVNIYGYVFNSAGEPRPDTDVRLSLTMKGDSVRNLDTLTDISGRYSFTVPRMLTNDSTCRYQYYTVETHTADGFNATKNGSYFIFKNVDVSIKLKDSYNLAEGLEFTIDTERLGSLEPRKPVKCWWGIFDNNADSVLTGTAMSGTVVLTPSTVANLKAGKYYFGVKALNDRFSVVTKSVILYNTDRPELPVNQMFYIPEIMTENKDGNINVLIGSADANTVLWYMPQKGDARLQSLILDSGFQTVALKADTDGEMLLWSVKDGKIYNTQISVKEEKKPDSLSVSLENFRDKTEAMSTQKWRLVTRLNDKPVEAAVILNAYDNRLHKYDYGILPILRKQRRFSSFTREMCFEYKYPNRFSLSYSGRLKIGLSPEMFFPEWLYTDSYSWRQYKESNVVTSVRGVNSLSGSVGGLEVVESRSSSYLESSAIEEDTADLQVAGYGAIYGSRAAGAGLDKIKLRQDNLLTALWEPALTTDSVSGEADVSFVVPNQTSTWRLSAFAWLRNLETASVSKTFTSSMPLYVSTNMPRFVRVGDRVAVVTAVTNNTDTVQNVMYDVTVGNETTAGSLTIEPHGVRMVTTMAQITGLTALSDSLALVFRASNGSYGDGERVTIPILPSTALVVESEPFYMNPADVAFSTVVPNSGTELCTLDFTANPMWSVVESLKPVLEDFDDIMPIATHYAAAWYAANTAGRIVRDHPVAKSMIDGALASEISTKSIDKLEALQRPDGAFVWGEWSAAPSFTTTLAVLNWFDQDINERRLKELIDKALVYLDNNVALKGTKDVVDYLYTLIRGAYGEPSTVEGKYVIANTLNNILKNWKTLSLGKKCIAAMILQRNGRVEAAKEVMRSIVQHGVVKDNRGFVFPNMPSLTGYANLLEAFRAIEPADTLVDSIRQGLLCYRRGASWGNCYQTAYAVRAIIESGTDWTVPAEPVEVSLNGKLQNVPTSDRLSGAFSMSLVSDSPSMKVDIRKAPSTPAYGAVVTRRVADLGDTPAYGTKSLKIDKEIVSKKNAFHPGEKVTVRLLVFTDTEMTNVIVSDERPAALEPVNQFGQYHRAGAGCWYYEQTTSTATNLFIDRLPKGYSVIEYEAVVNNSGTFATGIATLTSGEDTDLTAHSASTLLLITPQQ